MHAMTPTVAPLSRGQNGARERALLRAAVLDALSGRTVAYVDTSRPRAARTRKRWMSLRREMRVERAIPLRLLQAPEHITPAWLEPQAVHADVIIIDAAGADIPQGELAALAERVGVAINISREGT